MIFQSPGAIICKIGSVTVRWYGIMIAIGFVCGTMMATRLAKVWNLDHEKIVNGALLAFIGGVAGGRLYYVAITWDYFRHHPSEIIATWNGGMSIHGGLIGGFITAALYCYFAKLPVLKVLDLGGCTLPLAQAIGRWGNFFNSEAFGAPVGNEFPLRLYIPKENRPFPFSLNEYFHPTFLYECVWNLLLFSLLYYVLSKKLSKYPGMLFLVYIAGYSIGRLLIEPLRLDSIMAGSTRIPMLASGIGLGISLLLMACTMMYYKRNRKNEAVQISSEPPAKDPQSNETATD